MRYVPALDGLRALAVMLVFLHHTHGQLFPGGWVGVDIFFVLSGYLITSILVGEHETTGVISLSRFYMRRACRLLPALFVVVCVAIAIAFWFHYNTRNTTIDAVAALLYLADYGYVLMPAHWSFLGHTWSLSVEEQFYFIWPLLLIVLLKWSKRRIAFYATLVLIFVVAVWRGFVFVTSSDLGATSAETRAYVRIYCAFDTRADVLLIGCALALWQPQVAASRFLNRLWPAVVLLLAVVVLKVSPSGRLLRYIDLVGYPLFGASVAYLIVILTSDENSFLTYFLSLPPIVAFGRISYGFYLWHYLIVNGPVKDRLITHRTPLTFTLSTFALSLAAAVASYWLIERPFLRLKLARFSTVHPRSGGARPRAFRDGVHECILENLQNVGASTWTRRLLPNFRGFKQSGR